MNNFYLKLILKYKFGMAILSTKVLLTILILSLSANALHTRSHSKL